MTRPPKNPRRTSPLALQRLRELNARRHLLPKCRATSRSTGERCRRLAMANGTCHFHGGRTPKGRDWHRPRWPKGSRPDASEKLHRKLKDHERTAKKRAKRVAAMSDEERARHEAWQATHKPGVDRAALREERRRAEEARALLRTEQPDRISPEAAALDEKIEKLKRLIADLEAQDLYQRGEGVFG